MADSRPPFASIALSRVAEWVVVVGVVAVLAWTTLHFGGRPADSMPSVSAGVFALSVLAGGALLCHGKLTGGGFHRATLLPVPFLLFALASILWLAPAPWLAWREWLLWFQGWIMFAVVLHFGRGPKQTWVLVGGLGLLGLVGVAMASYQRFVNLSWLADGRTQAGKYLGRSSGMFDSPNSLAAFLELLIPACLTLLASRAVRPGTKIFCAWLAVLFLFALGLTGSRGGWLVLGLALASWPLFAGRVWSRKILGIVVVLAVVAGSLGALYRFSDRARMRVEPLLAGQVEVTRPQIWAAGVKIWQAHPWLGSGAGSFDVLFQQHRPPRFDTNPQWAHNDYLNTLSDYGVVGFALWFGAGVGLGVMGWRAMRRARSEPSAKSIQHLAKWKLGVLLGLVAFCLHLAIDFHTKIPALLFAAAVVTAVLVRDEPEWRMPWNSWAVRGAGLALILTGVGVGVRVAWPSYRAEAMRVEVRARLNAFSVNGQGDLPGIAISARQELSKVVRLDPENAQAWADLAYATALGWRNETEAGAAGRFAELAAEEALKRCPIEAEFWVRKGMALDIQHGRPEAEDCFRQAVELAPSSPAVWYHYALYLAQFPERRSEAMQAVTACLTLDPYLPVADSLRRQLAAL